MIFEEDNFAEEYEDLNIRSKEFTKIEFDECIFRKCDFSSSSFINCIFTGCYFYNCDLSLIKILNTKFSDINFIDCKVIGVDWTKASWDSLVNKPIKFKNTVINSSSFYGLKLESMEVKDCEARDVDFREANLKESNFTCTDFQKSIFFNTNLTKVNFSYAQNFNIDIKNNILKGALFSRYEALTLLNGLEIEFID